MLKLITHLVVPGRQHPTPIDVMRVVTRQDFGLLPADSEDVDAQTVLEVTPTGGQVLIVARCEHIKVNGDYVAVGATATLRPHDGAQVARVLLEGHRLIITAELG